MKNILVYYFALLVPLAALIYSIQSQVISATFFTYALLIYALIYRPLIDGKRLIEKEVLKRHEIWKLFIPGYSRRFFLQLYWTN